MGNATKKFKRGDIREDGMIFWRYQSRGDEYWVTKDKFIQKKESDAGSSKKYRENHFDKWKSWYKKNSHRINQIAATRRARKRMGLILATSEDKMVINELYIAAKRIKECTGISFEVDHIHPLSKGGIHHPSNLQLLPASINRRKYSKINFKY
jgi:5-methylcytosine-specific restriction endonuclease McrA